jgi:exonuclease III
VNDFNTPLSPIVKSSNSSPPKKSMRKLQNKTTLNQIDLIDSYRIFYPRSTEYTLFSAVQGMFYKIVHRH